MAEGYAGKLLRVNLSTGKVSTETLDDLFYRIYMGGWSLVAYYLLREVPKGTDPLGPENRLIFAPGVLTGAPLSGCGRSAMGAKSPLTGGFGEADVGGYFGAELTHAGWDGLIVEGKADHPVIISIADEKVEIKDASHLWGKDTLETQDTLKAELGESKTRFAVIGQAGENQVLYACVMHDDNHAVGRAGLGAVMGSKNLKAVAVKGSGKKEVHDRDQLKQVAKWLLKEGKEKWQGLHDNGTDGGLPNLSASGGLPTKNFKYGHFEEADDIGGETMTKPILVDRTSCYSCVVRCKRAVEVKEGPFKVDPKYGGPEYETAAAFGSNCGVGDLAAVASANQHCNALGLDTISTGMMISFAMECYENGIITKHDTDGMELSFGNAEAMVQLVQKISEREGLGDLLAGGYKACIKVWGERAEQYAFHVKGQPLPMHEPRLKFGLGLGYAISPTGADHVHNIHDTMFATEDGLPRLTPFGILTPQLPQDLDSAKVRLFYYVMHNELLKNVLGVCLFLPYFPNMLVDIVRGVSGWDTSLLELLKAAERGLAMARAFNAREGFTAADDKLPERYFEAFDSGPLEGVSQDPDQFKSALETFYNMAGWDLESGAPTRSKLSDLGLEWVSEMLYEQKPG